MNFTFDDEDGKALPERRVKIDATAIVLYTEEGRYGQAYEILKSRIDTPMKLVWWIHHLSEKNWVTTGTIRALIYHAMIDVMGMKMYEGEG